MKNKSKDSGMIISEIIFDDYNYEYRNDFENFRRNKTLDETLPKISAETNNKIEVTEKLNDEYPINKYPLNEDKDPIVIKKKSEELITHELEISINYLKPPTPAPPGEIIIREDTISTPPAPPLIIRQEPIRLKTPEPLVIHEEPPKAPHPIKQKIITIPGKYAPAPPRKVVVEKLPELPLKPKNILVERWLPYSKQKQKVIFVPNKEADVEIKKPKNLIIQWEEPKVTIKKKYTNLGVVRTNPDEYISKYGDEVKSKSIVDKIVPQIHAGIRKKDEKSPVLELEGDIEALKLVDLDREGLSCYKQLLSEDKDKQKREKTPTRYSNKLKSNSSNDDNQSKNYTFDAAFLNYFLANSFATLDESGFLKIRRQDGFKLFKKLNKALELEYSKEDMKKFISAFNHDNLGFIDFNEFKSGIISKLLVNNHDQETKDSDAVFWSRRNSNLTESHSQPASRAPSWNREESRLQNNNLQEQIPDTINHHFFRRASSLRNLDFSNQNEW